MITEKPFLLILLILLAALVLSRYLRPLLNPLLKRFSKTLPPDLKEPFESGTKLPLSLLIFFVTCRIGFSFAPLESKYSLFLKLPLKSVLALGLLLLSWRLLDLLEGLISLKLKEGEEAAQEKPASSSDSITKHLLPYSKRVLKILITVIAVLLFLQNTGFNVNSILAGLGIGGIAVALAAKETLGNFFGGFTVMADRPFSVGDWIVCGDVEGTVEDIGFRSTKVKTFYDSLVTIPNSSISNSVIDNLGKRRARRTRITLDLNYETSPEKLEAFLAGVREIIKSSPYSRKDYYQCYLSGYGSYSLQVILNFFLKVSDWDSELAEKQSIFLKIMQLSKKLGVKFAFPTQTISVPELSSKQPPEALLPLKEQKPP